MDLHHCFVSWRYRVTAQGSRNIGMVTTEWDGCGGGSDVRAGGALVGRREE